MTALTLHCFEAPGGWMLALQRMGKDRHIGIIKSEMDEQTARTMARHWAELLELEVVERSPIDWPKAKP